MATEQELSGFLASVEKRAFKRALYAVREEDHALDIVQDAMLKLTVSYSSRPAAELPMLFQRILQNVMMDHFRKEKVQRNWFSVFSSFRKNTDDEGDQGDDIDAVLSQATELLTESGADIMAREQVLLQIEDEIKKLPERQREAFLIRYWEEMDVATTASIMKCSEGSVKTHCSRALKTLSRALIAKGISL